MTSFQIADTKNFMKHLLLSDTFDRFLTVEASLTTYSTFLVDGHLQKDYYSEEELESLELSDCMFSYWFQIKPIFLSLIKGQHTPQNFKIVLQLSPKNIAKLLSSSGSSFSIDDVSGLYLNLKFDGEHITCITGSSLNIFTLDKSLEHAWDEMVQRFLKQKEIAFL